MIISNPWIGYFDRTYVQIKTSVLTILGANVPEITDHTETNPWVKGISIWSGIAEMLGYYLDSNAREAYIGSALEFASGVKVARMFDYRVKGAVPASVAVRFTSNIAATGPITIPIGTKIETDNGEYFETTTLGLIGTGETFVDVQAKQWKKISGVSLGNSDGSADQDFALEEDVVDNSVIVTVDVVQYIAQDTFAYSFPADEHFVAGLDEDTKMHVKFGDDLNGKIPPGGQSITVDYYVTLGDAGNVGAGKITTITDTITVPGGELITVNNALNATGGTDFESLTRLKKRIPISIRTRWRAVTEQDFIYVTELFAGVERAGVSADCDVDKYVHVFIVPEGGGVASQALIDDVTAFLEIRRIVLSKPQVQGAGELTFKLTIAVNALPGYSNALIQSSVSDAVVAFFDSTNQEIKGKVTIGDVYQVIEDVTGVNYSTITLMVAVPYARPITDITHVLNWTRAVQAASNSTVKWLIKFISVSTFELYRDEIFQGSFAVDVPVVQSEIHFTVNGNHTSGDNFEFYTYAYNQSVFLTEPSIPAAEAGDLTITVTGGV